MRNTLKFLILAIITFVASAVYAYSPELFANLFGIAGGGIMLGTISAFDTRTMIAALEKMFPPRTFLRDLFFKEEQVFDTKVVQLDIYKGNRKIAPYVSRRNPGQVVGHDSYKTNSFEPPYVKPKMVLEPSQMYTRSIGENIYTAKSPAQRMMEYASKCLVKLDNMITRREEQQASEALFTGKIVLENGDIDFALDASHNLTLSGTDLWTHADSDIYAQLETWSDLILKDSGYLPDTLIISSTAAAAMMNNTKFKAKLDLLKLNIGTIEPKTFPNGVKFYGTITGLGIDIWGYSETYLDTDGVTNRKMVPDNKVLLASSQMRGVKLYGAIEHKDALIGLKRFPYSWTEEDPSAMMLQVHSAPLMNPVDVDAFIVADVI